MDIESQSFADAKYRRGAILGLTVAEIFILLLFLLMLVFLVLSQEQQAREQEQNRELEQLREFRQTWEGSLAGIETPDEIVALKRWRDSASEPGSDANEELARLLVEAEQARDIAQGERQQAMQENERLIARSEQQQEEFGQQQEKLEQQAQILEQLQEENQQFHELAAELEDRMADQGSALAAASNQRDALSAELARAKAGELVICTYEPPGPDSASPLRGRSIPLGTVHLEADGVTLIERNGAIESSDIVDYVGDNYDTEEAARLLGSWILHQKISFDELESIGNQFIAIGDMDVLTRSRCRFSMNYYIEDYVTPHSVLLEFERFFFQQSRISDARFDQLANTSR